jgi:hypothetical protein
MFLDWYGIPQLDLSYALLKIAEIPGFNVNGMYAEDLRIMVEEALANGISGGSIAMQMADQLQVAPGLSLMDIQYMDIDSSAIMDSILGGVINNDLSGWYMDAYGEIRHPSWEFYGNDYELGSYDDQAWYALYGEYWEEYKGEWQEWYDEYGQDYYGEYEYVSEYDDDYWDWWYSYYDQGEFYYSFGAM